MRMNETLTGKPTTVAVPPPRLWGPDTWRERPIQQQPAWPDPHQVSEVAEQISLWPPLVPTGEIDLLRHRLAEAAQGRAFVLQAGDCAERFEYCTEAGVRNKLRVLLQMAALLTYGSGLPVVGIGRIAGQYAKPRSAAVETVDGVRLPVYRGDIVNRPEPLPGARLPDPARMREAYQAAAVTLNVLHGLTRHGAGDLAQVHAGTSAFARRCPDHAEAAEELARTLRCASAFAPAPSALPDGLFTSHEALLLEFEQALLRYEPETGRWFDTSAHTVWVGERTRGPDDAHVEFLSGIANPVGVKLGPTATPEEVLELCDRLDPHHVPGRLVLVSRLGADRVRDTLPPLLRAVRASGHPVVWMCDPMHGNTRSAGGYKTRDLDDIRTEIAGFLAATAAEGVHAGGLHLELTGENVTECLGGVSGVGVDDLGGRYETACDPRLNAEQSVELAFEVSDLLRRHLG